jgi:hypothetical protein
MGHLILGKFAREHLHYSTLPFLYLLVPEPAGDAEVFAGGFDEVGGGE